MGVLWYGTDLQYWTAISQPVLREGPYHFPNANL